MKNGSEAAKLLQDVGKWIVTLDTGAIGALGYFVLLKSDALQGGTSAVTTHSTLIAQLSWFQQILLVGSLSAFGFSLLFASWLLLALPGVMQRYTEESQHDIFLEGTFNGVGFTIACFASLEHALFVLGIFLFAAFATSFWSTPWTSFFSVISAVWLGYVLLDVKRSWNDLRIRNPRA